MEQEDEKTNAEVKKNNMNYFAYIAIGMNLLFIINTLLNDHFDKIGSGYLYAYAGFALLTLALVILYVTVYVKVLYKIKELRNRFVVINVLLAVVLVFMFFVTKDYIMDIFGGSQTVTTTEYHMECGEHNIVQFLGNDGQKTRAYLSDEIAHTLNANPWVEANAWTDNCMYLHEKSITIVYYPHSGVLVNVVVNE